MRASAAARPTNGSTKNYYRATSFTNGENQTTNVYYDSSARLTKRAWPRITTSVSGTQDPVWQAKYNAGGQLTHFLAPKGADRGFVFDTHGYARTMTMDPGGLGLEVKQSYDATGRVTRRVGPRGDAVDTSYDSGGRATRQRRYLNAAKTKYLDRERYYGANGRVTLTRRENKDQDGDALKPA